MMLAVAGIYLTFVLNSPIKEATPPASFAQANAAVLATVKEGDLILCADPATNQVRYALLVESSVPQESKVLIHGYFMNKYSTFRTNRGILPSYFDTCRVEAFRDNGLGSVDQKIGKIIRSGLNPPSPPK